MTRPSVPERELVTTTEITVRTGVSRGRVAHWRKRYLDFPEVVGTGERGVHLYDWRQVRECLDRHGLPDREKAQRRPWWELLRDGKRVGLYRTVWRARVMLIRELLADGGQDALELADRVVKGGGRRGDSVMGGSVGGVSFRIRKTESRS